MKIGDRVKLLRDFSCDEFPISLAAGYIGKVISEKDQNGAFMADFTGIVLLVDSSSASLVLRASRATHSCTHTDSSAAIPDKSTS